MDYDYLELQRIGKLQNDLIEMAQSAKLETKARALKANSIENTEKRELILEDMNVILKDMKAIMLELYKLNEGVK